MSAVTMAEALMLAPLSTNDLYYGLRRDVSSSVPWLRVLGDFPVANCVGLTDGYCDSATA